MSCFPPGFDIPRPGDYVARFTGIHPNGRAAGPPVIRPGELQVLLYGDSTCTRFTLAPEAQSVIGKFSPAGPSYPEYGHMGLAHLFAGKKVNFFQFAISGQRLACSGSPSAAEVRTRVYDAFQLDSDFKFHVVFVRAGTNDLKFHVSSKNPRFVDDVFHDFQLRLRELHQVFGSKVVYLGAGITSLEGNILPEANSNHVLGGERSRSEVRVFPYSGLWWS